MFRPFRQPLRVPHPTRASSGILPLALALGALGAFSCGGAERTPVSNPPRGEAAAEVRAEASGLSGPCARCHAAIADEWSRSLHRVSFTDRDFQASFAAEPADFCFRCHAPEAKNRDDVLGAARGTGCVSCHEAAKDHERAPSASTVKTRGCNGCHEFAFPGRSERDAMQRTMTEHANSPYRDTSCVTCHMERAFGHRSHSFPASRDESRLSNAISLEWARAEGGHVSLAFRTNGVGHAFPTGDLFRRLRVYVWLENAEGHVLGDGETFLARSFDHSAPKDRTIETDDTRIHGRRVVEFDLHTTERASRLGVRVEYDRAAGRGTESAALFDRRVILERDVSLGSP